MRSFILAAENLPFSEITGVVYSLNLLLVLEVELRGVVVCIHLFSQFGRGWIGEGRETIGEAVGVDPDKRPMRW